MTLAAVNAVDQTGASSGLLPLWVFAGVYLFQFVAGNDLLQDSDLFWQIEVGRWILAHRAVPYQDIYSFTQAGAPWMSTSWLAQVLFAVAYAQGGFALVVALSSLAIAATFALFAAVLQKYVEPALATLAVMAALLLSIHHLLARPHVLALPVMVAWFAGLLAAAERRRAPSPWLLGLIALWANLHGGFVLGLALLGGVALEALWVAAPERRVGLGVRWLLFGLAALAACCATPYGWQTLDAARGILSLGQLLSVLSEWQPADFSQIGAFEAAVLGLIGVALYRRLTLSWPRVLLVLALLHMALQHVRSIEAFALLVPLLLAKPWSEQLGLRASTIDGGAAARVVTGLVVAVALAAVTVVMPAYRPFAFVASQVPAAAVEVLKQREARRVFNAYEFGGYLIKAGVPVFIDGRAEFYGEAFGMAFHRAVALRDVDGLPQLLAQYQIDATLLGPAAPAVQLLDRLDGWQRVYADDVAVIHARMAR